MRKSITEEIDGFTYTCTQMPATEGLACFKKLVSMVGHEGMRLAFFTDEERQNFASRNDISLEEANGQINTLVMQSVCEALEKLDNGFFKQMLTGMRSDLVCMPNAEKPLPMPEGSDLVDHFDEHFAGEYMHLLKVLQLSLKTNFLNPTRGAH